MKKYILALLALAFFATPAFADGVCNEIEIENKNLQYQDLAIKLAQKDPERAVAIAKELSERVAQIPNNDMQAKCRFLDEAIKAVSQ